MTSTVGVVTTGDALTEARDTARAALVGDEVPRRLTAADDTLWGPEAQPESAIRLGWLGAAGVSRALLPRLVELRAELVAEGIDHVVLCGMGGSSLAPEVICRTAGAALTVLDTTDPQQVTRALQDRLASTVAVVSSKSGGTLETDSHYRIYLEALGRVLPPGQAARRVVVVTDPGSPLEQQARADGVREVFLADPHVGGRYSALTAFGIVPSALAGVDVAALLAEAESVSPTLATSDANPGLDLAAALGGGGLAGRDKVILSTAPESTIVGFGDWAEQLVAESTGKSGRGLLPVVVDAGTETAVASDRHLVTIGASSGVGTAVDGPLGAQFLVWEWATAAAGRLLAINPFDQPNVAESKANTSSILDEAGDGPLPDGTPAFSEGPVTVYADATTLATATTLTGALEALLAGISAGGYLAVMAYLDRVGDAPVAQLRSALAQRTSRPVTFGWGPRFLHSTGQFHKGGPQTGSFLQITAASTTDVPVPGRPFGLARLQMAQALGDLRALESRHRPVVRIHLHDRAAGIQALLEAAAA